jgi:phospholipase C
VDVLMARRSELRLARARGGDGARPLTQSTQAGFLQVALLKVLVGVTPPDRDQWIEDYKSIKTNLDGAIFMTEAKLKLRHGIDVKKVEREGRREAARNRERLRR